MSKNLAVLILVLLLVLASPFHCIAQEEKGGDNLRATVGKVILGDSPIFNTAGGVFVPLTRTNSM